MLLPFIENAFKHGASQMTEHPWISLNISIISDTLSMKLINGKPEIAKIITPGIGIENVRKQIDLLYPDQHKLIINDEKEMYIINLDLKLINNGDAQNF